MPPVAGAGEQSAGRAFSAETLTPPALPTPDLPAVMAFFTGLQWSFFLQRIAAKMDLGIESVIFSVDFDAVHRVPIKAHCVSPKVDHMFPPRQDVGSNAGFSDMTRQAEGRSSLHRT